MLSVQKYGENLHVNYSPFGAILYGRNWSSEKYRYGFDGQEKDDEVSGAGNSYTTEFWQYSSRLAVRWNIDPMFTEQSWLSPYHAFSNNPILMVDPDGRIPYPITVRAFAPFNIFGGGFHGDGAGRGFTTSLTASARVHQIIGFDTDKSKIKAVPWISPTFHILISGVSIAKSSVEFTDGFKTKTTGDSKTFIFGTHLKGANPMVPSSPNIDVFSDFTIIENKKAGTLQITGTLKGDNFPSTEAFISDPSGQRVFIGIGFYEGSPFSSLEGENKRLIDEFNFTITTDKEGNFTGVKEGGQNYSIKDWNKTFEMKDPHNKNTDK